MSLELSAFQVSAKCQLTLCLTLTIYSYFTGKSAKGTAINPFKESFKINLPISPNPFQQQVYLCSLVVQQVVFARFLSELVSLRFDTLNLSGAVIFSKITCFLKIGEGIAQSKGLLW
jgi:hypothetical protein